MISRDQLMIYEGAEEATDVVGEVLKERMDEITEGTTGVDA